MEIFSVVPNGIEQGQKNTVVIKGDGFPSGVTVTVSGIGVSVENVTQIDEDSLSADFEVSRTAPIGFRDVSVVPPTGSTVVLTGGIAITNFQSLVTQLRLLVGERIPPGKTDADTDYSNDELVDIVLNNRGNLYLAAATVWESKAAEAAELVDITESGSERRLSQLFKNASAQRDSYRQAGIDIQNQLIEPVVGQSVSWLRPSHSTTSDRSNDPFYDPFLFLAARRIWMPMAFSQNVDGLAMWGTRFQ